MSLNVVLLGSGGREHAIAWRSSFERLESVRRVYFHDVLREGPSEHRTNALPTLFGLPYDASGGALIKHLAQITPSNLVGIPLHQWGKRPLQASFDFSRGLQSS